MLLDKIESGILVLETPRGLMLVEPSFWQRVYLLWTFRNFRKLSLPLLNNRQLALIKTLASKPGRVSTSYDRTLAIGVVEKFVPEALEIDATAEATIPAPKIEAAPIKAVPIEEVLITDQISSKSDLPELGLLKEEPLEPAPIAPGPRRSHSVIARFSPSRLATSRLATSAGAVALCIVSVVAWQRTVPGSEAHNQTRPQMETAIAIPTPTNIGAPSAVAGNSAVLVQPAIAEAHPLSAESPVSEPPQIAPPADEPSSAERSLVPPSSLGPASDQPASVGASSVGPSSVEFSSPQRSPAKRSSIDPTAVMANPPTLAAITHDPTRVRVHTPTPAPSLPVAGQGSRIQATRPPLHVTYPVFEDVRARGIVALTAGVDADGKVRSVRVVRGNPALAAAAVRAVRQWRYRPYLKDGRSVATETNIVISFFASDAISMSFPPNIPITR